MEEGRNPKHERDLRHKNLSTVSCEYRGGHLTKNVWHVEADSSLWLRASKKTGTSVLQPQETGFCHNHVSLKEGSEVQMRTQAQPIP